MIDLNSLSFIFSDIINTLSRFSIRFGDFTFNFWVGLVALFAISALSNILWRNKNDK